MVRPRPQITDQTFSFLQFKSAVFEITPCTSAVKPVFIQLPTNYTRGVQRACNTPTPFFTCTKSESRLTPRMLVFANGG